VFVLVKDRRFGPRRGFTLIELLVVVAIIAVLIGLLIPAVQKAREAAARTQCVNNLKQMGVALHNYHDQNKRFPASGEVVNVAGNGTGFTRHSLFTWLLPHLEHTDIFDQFDLRTFYNGQAAAKNVIPTFLCPSNPARPESGRDSFGYGYTDYMPIAYTDINDTGVGNIRLPGGTGFPGRAPGALAVKVPGFQGYTDPTLAAADPNFTVAAAYPDGKVGPTSGDIIDGLSNTIAIMEDVGRSEQFTTPRYIDPSGVDVAGGFRSAWRWAEPDSANGASGPPGATWGTLGSTGVRMINNYSQPYGGPTACPWTTNNCGPNDEPFSFHGSGCNALFVDGHVSWLAADINPITYRRLLTPVEQIPPTDGDY
jgi:prepilin-type N-terminal cleavage/methylation domain-containing protein/prepilin-type processing-associated H-X9-DG protein